MTLACSDPFETVPPARLIAVTGGAGFVLVKGPKDPMKRVKKPGLNNLTVARDYVEKASSIIQYAAEDMVGEGRMLLDHASKHVDRLRYRINKQIEGLE